MANITDNRQGEHLWAWRYYDPSCPRISPHTQDDRASIGDLLQEIARTWIDDGAQNWIEFDGQRVATVFGPNAFAIGG